MHCVLALISSPYLNVFLVFVCMIILFLERVYSCKKDLLIQEKITGELIMHEFDLYF